MNTKSVRLFVVVDKKQHDSVSRAADKRGISMSEYVRNCIEAGLEAEAGRRKGTKFVCENCKQVG